MQVVSTSCNKLTVRAVARALIGECIFIYSCYARLICFEISCH